MKNSMKAALLSGLIFPGIGHLYLKRYLQGILLTLGAGSALYYIISVVVATALEVVDKMQYGEVPLDMDNITTLVSQQLSGAEQSTNLAMLILVVIWVIGVVDSYRQGRAQELEAERSAARKS